MATALTRPLLGAALALVVGCGDLPSPALAPVQTFDFATQPVAFAPPAKPWEAEKELSGGLRGIRYVKRGSVGEGIGIADYYDVSGRLRRAELAKLLATDSNNETFEYDHALRRTWARTDKPYSALETEVAQAINSALSRANQARKERDYAAVRSELLVAQAAAERLHFSMADVIDRAVFRPEASINASRYETLGRRETKVAGQPALVLDFTIDLPEGRRYLRKVYVFYNDHLFVAEFVGLEKTLPLFDKVVASIAFPP